MKFSQFPSCVQLLCVALPALLTSPFSHAELGGNVTSVQTDAVHMKAVPRVVTDDAENVSKSQKKYNVHEIQTPAGVAVREYASVDGKVFAVAWQGATLPDLRQLLGAYFETYSDGVKNKRGTRGHLRIQQPGLVVHSNGRMRAFFGKAYVPGMLPAGVTPEEIQ